MASLSIEQLLKFGDPVFKKIEKAIKDYSGHSDVNCFSDELRLLFNSPQPKEWIETSKSELLGGEYEYNKIELMEALMNKVFGSWGTSIESNSIMGDKNGFVSTTVVNVSASLLEFSEKYFGISSTFAPTIKHLSLATPLSKSEAKKNAIKEIGIFFGRRLNRFDNALPEIQISKQESEVDVEFERIKTTISSMSKADAEMYVASLPGWKLNFELKEIIKQKK